MKMIILLSVVVIATAYSNDLKPNLDEHWQHYKNAFGKTYSASEEAKRRNIWEERINGIIQHNLRADLGLHSFTRGLNKYSDLSYDEFMTKLNGFKRIPQEVFNNTGNRTWYPPDGVHVPDHFDCRDKGLVTPVKDQGGCGGCWAFSTTGALEAQHKKKTGILVRLSEQNLIDCTKENHGCNGGFMRSAFDYVIKQNGIDTERSYPYLNSKGPCRFNPKNVGAICSGYLEIPIGNEEVLKQAVAIIGPVSVALDAHHQSFHDYRNGIYDEPGCGSDLTDLTHAALAVGYGTEDGKDFWLVKNSWGESFGNKGYIKMSRNKNNQCGLATRATFPLM